MENGLVQTPDANVCDKTFLPIFPQLQLIICFTYNTAIMCDVLKEVLNAILELTNGNLFGSVATYTCLDGYSLVGDSSITCLASGSWSNKEPVCQC